MIALPASILFVCTRNAVRSAMAEAMMKQLHGTRVFVDSAGTACAGTARAEAARAGTVRAEAAHGEFGADPFAVAVMAEIDLDISGHRPKALDDLDDMSFDLIAAFTADAADRAGALTRTTACDVIHWPAADATLVEGSRTTRLAAYRAVRDAIQARLKQEFPAPPVASQ